MNKFEVKDMELKQIIVGLTIGLILGAGVGYSFNSTDDASNINTLDSKLQSEYYQLEKDYNKLLAKLSQLENEVSTKESQIIQLSNELALKDSKITELEAEINQYLELLPPPPPEEGEPGSSRLFPADLNEEITCIYDRSSKMYAAAVTVLEIIRGEEAWRILYETNSVWNDEPPSGYEYVLAKIRFKLIKMPDGVNYYSLTRAEFEAVSENGVVYDYDPFLVPPQPDISADLYEGATHIGWTAFLVEISDKKPVMSFQRDDGKAWFKLYS